MPGARDEEDGFDLREEFSAAEERNGVLDVLERVPRVLFKKKAVPRHAGLEADSRHLLRFAHRGRHLSAGKKEHRSEAFSVETR